MGSFLQKQEYLRHYPSYEQLPAEMRMERFSTNHLRNCSSSFSKEFLYVSHFLILMKVIFLYWIPTAIEPSLSTFLETLSEKALFQQISHKKSSLMFNELDDLA